MWFFQRRACRSTDRHGAVAAAQPHALAQPVRQSLLAATCAQVLDKSWKEKTGATSRTLGTSGKRLWLLRSRPDPVEFYYAIKRRLFASNASLDRAIAHLQGS